MHAFSLRKTTKRQLKSRLVGGNANESTSRASRPRLERKSEECLQKYGWRGSSGIPEEVRKAVGQGTLQHMRARSYGFHVYDVWTWCAYRMWSAPKENRHGPVLNTTAPAPRSPVETPARAASPREAGLHGDVAPVPFLATEANTRAVPRLVDSLAYKKRNTFFSLYSEITSQRVEGCDACVFPQENNKKAT